MIIYTVRPVVCDYGLFENETLLLILNSRTNALLVEAVLNADLVGEKYTVSDFCHLRNNMIEGKV